MNHHRLTSKEGGNGTDKDGDENASYAKEAVGHIINGPGMGNIHVTCDKILWVIWRIA